MRGRFSNRWRTVPKPLENRPLKRRGPTVGAVQADIGIIGGSGFYSFLSDIERVSVDTPFGEPSAPLAVGEVNGRRVAFLPRHGEQHQFPPHRVNYRANLWALRSVGVRQVLAPCAVGGLRADLAPGTFVVPDQVVDRTCGRAHTIWDAIGPVVHTSFADPYCPRGRAAFLAANPAAVDGGTLVVAGDFNQSVPYEQWYGSRKGEVAMDSALRELDLLCLTDGNCPLAGRPRIDHICVGRNGFAPGCLPRIGGWAIPTVNGRPVTDHSGVFVDLPRAGSQ